MGFFRLALAIAVLISHLPELVTSTVISRGSLHLFIWSGNAVFAFFIISGFYMAMVFNQRYCKLDNGTRRFYLNRALRLYPAHWTVLILYALVFYFAGVPSFLLGDTLGKDWLWPIAMFSNVFFFGAELIAFSDTTNWAFVLGPVWSLSIEAYFYVLAPFFVTRSIRFIVVLTLLALLFRLGLYWAGVEQLPWRYFFFPAVFCFFCLGVLAYRVFQLIKDRPYMRSLGLLAAAVLISFTVYEPFWLTAGTLDAWQSWVFYLTVTLCTPFLFQLTRNSAFDNWLGHLAYPVFIGHMLVIELVKASGITDSAADKGVIVLLGSLLLAQILYMAIEKPVDKFRRTISH